MALTTTEMVAGVGARRGVVYVLDATTGLPLPATYGGGAYIGTFVEGIKDYTITGAEPQKINHYGDDRVFMADQLAPTEAASFDMTTGVDNQILDSGLSGVKRRTFGTTSGKFIAAETNKKGQEPQVAFWGFRQALDSNPANTSTYGKLRQYNARGINSMKVTVNPNGGQQTLSDQTYVGVPTPTKSTFWGETFTTGTWGCTEAALVRGNTNYPGLWHFYRGTSTIGTFPLVYSPVAGDISSITVFVSGSESVPGSVTYGSSPAFSLTAVPANDVLIAALVQTADSF